ncbi:MAG: FecR family protein [Niabella sp.]|nr:FecR family protein [Niabella sp.]
MDEDLIKKYFTGNCSPEEKRRIYLYLRKHPVRFLKHFPDEEWSGLQTDPEQKKYAGQAPFLFIPERRQPFLCRRPVALVLMLFLLVPFFLHQSAKTLRPRTRPDVPLTQLIEIKNTLKQPEHLQLPDGSSVELFAGSSISYLKNFAPAKRDVHLKGTAIFEVAKNPHAPFTVYCNKVATTALGTKFKICTSNKKRVLISLLEGKIVVHPTETALSKEKYYLTEGNAIAFDVVQHTVKRLPAFKTITSKPLEPTGSITLTKEGTLHFDNIPLPRVLDYLEQKRQVTIQYQAKPISKIRFIGTVYYNEPVKDILHNLSLLTGLRLSVKIDSARNDTLYIFKPAD